MINNEHQLWDLNFKLLGPRKKIAIRHSGKRSSFPSVSNLNLNWLVSSIRARIATGEEYSSKIEDATCDTYGRYSVGTVGGGGVDGAKKELEASNLFLFSILSFFQVVGKRCTMQSMQSTIYSLFKCQFDWNHTTDHVRSARNPGTRCGKAQFCLFLLCCRQKDELESF